MNAPSRPPLILTDAQFEDMARKGAFAKVGRVELRRGMIEVMSPVYLNHSLILSRLFLVVATEVAAKLPGLVATTELSVKFGGGFQPVSDIVIWDETALQGALDGPLPGGAARLVIEVLESTLADDLGEKMQDYARAGLPEYWVVDVKGRIVFLHTKPDQDGYKERNVVRFGEALQSLTLPLELDTRSL
jgi:Uma2 family endonuclease